MTSVIRGERARTDSIRTGAESARVSGFFVIESAQIRHVLEETLGQTLEDGELLIERHFHRRGRHRARANGLDIPLAVLRRVGEVLFEIEGQRGQVSLLTPAVQREQLAAEVPLFGRPLKRALDGRRASERQIIHAALRAMIDRLVTDLIETTTQRLAERDVQTVGDIRGAGEMLVGLSPAVAEENRRLKGFLRENLYQHHRIERMKDKARRLLRALFERYLDNPRLLPQYSSRSGRNQPLERIIADYIAGMTDRYAIDEYQRLFEPTVLP